MSSYEILNTTTLKNSSLYGLSFCNKETGTTPEDWVRGSKILNTEEKGQSFKYDLAFETLFDDPGWLKEGAQVIKTTACYLPSHLNHLDADLPHNPE